MSTSAPSHGYVLTVLIGFDVLINSILGGRSYETISSRIGRSIQSGGWGAKIPWPQALKQHFLTSIVTITLT